MPDDHNAEAFLAQQGCNLASRRSLSRPGPDGTDRHDRLLRGDHGAAPAQQAEVGPRGQYPRCLMHDGFVRDIAVGENNLIDLIGRDQRLEFLLGVNRDALRIQGASQLRRIATPRNVRNLRCGEGDDSILRTVAIHHVEVVEIAASRSHDQHRRDRHNRILPQPKPSSSRNSPDNKATVVPPSREDTPPCPPLRASNEALLRARVARAQKIINLHPLSL